MSEGYNMNKYTIAEKSKKVRHVFGITQPRLADEIDTSTKNVCRWEKGHCIPLDVFKVKIEALHKRAEYLEGKADLYLMEGEFLCCRCGRGVALMKIEVTECDPGKIYCPDCLNDII